MPCRILYAIVVTGAVLVEGIKSHAAGIQLSVSPGGVGDFCCRAVSVGCAARNTSGSGVLGSKARADPRLSASEPSVR
jgi:hypothetical protein